MTDDGTGSTEFWRDIRVAGQAKRERNRDHSRRLLEAAGVQFDSRNGGAHLIVAGRIDFWPGTGKWIVRGETKQRRGVHELLVHLQRGK